MNRLNIIALMLIYVMLSACMPVIAPSPSPKEPINTLLPENFKQPKSIYLTIPVWDKYPGYYDETSWKDDHKNIAGKPFYISGDEMDKLHEKIPRKVNVGIASIAANTGREIVPKGVLIFSESGQSIYAKLCRTSEIFDLKWCNIYDFQINYKYRFDLIELIKTKKKDKTLIENVFESALNENDYIRLGNPYY